jgi:hypothetical protein
MHDEAVLRGYGAWEATSGHRARRGKQRGKRRGLGASPTRAQDEAQPAVAPSYARPRRWPSPTHDLDGGPLMCATSTAAAPACD